MLTVMLTGVVTRPPEQRLDRRQRPFATAGLQVADAEGAPVLVSLIAFRTLAIAALARLRVGDDVSLVGHASLGRWNDPDGRKRTGLNVTVSRILTLDDAGTHHTPQDRREWRESAAQEAAGG